MIAGALLAASLLAGPEVAAPDVVARLRVEPAEVEVGEAFRLVLEVDSPPGTSVKLPESDPSPDDSWVLLEPRKIVRPDAARTIATWSLLSLEAGEKKLPSLQIGVEDASGARKIDVPADTLRVRPALVEGEDAPRPMRGFRQPPEGSAGARSRLVLLVALGLAALAGGFFLLRRRKAKAAPLPRPTALDGLAALQRRVAEDPERIRGVVYDLSRLLRGSVDEFLSEDRAALVDAEWAARTDPDERVPLGARRSIARILRDSERIKYALQAPTRFAVEEMLADARNALEALASAPRPAIAQRPLAAREPAAGEAA